MKSRYTITNFNYKIQVIGDTEQNIKRAIRNSHTRKKYDIFSIISNDDMRFCAFCGKHNVTWKPKIEIHGSDVSIVGITYDRPIYYCCEGNKYGCKGGKLNKNSVAFVSATRKLSNEDALRLIHDRNSSSFYRENHASEEAYLEYQRSRVTSMEPEKYAKHCESLKFKQSKAGYIAKHGEKGAEIWNEVQRKKNNCLDNFIRKFGVDEGQKRYDLYTERQKKFETQPMLGNIHYTKDGQILRSNIEKAFYDTAEKYGLLEYEHHIGKAYCSEYQLKYDFYFPTINLYIEIAGLTNAEYLKRIELKNGYSIH